MSKLTSNRASAIAFTIASAAAVLTTGCVSHAPIEPAPAPVSALTLVNEALFQEPRPTGNVDAVFALNDAQQASFLKFFNDPERAERPPHERVFEYVQAFSHQFDYLGTTYSATEALSLREGNCLSLAIVTTALARLVDVPVGYQLIDSSPVYSRRGDFVMKAHHVRTLLHNRTSERVDGALSFRTSTLIVDYFPDRSNRLVRSISEADYTAMYYRNLAADALVAGDLSQAMAHTRTAAKLAPVDAGVVGLLALIHRRAGDDASAEALYRFGLEHNGDDLTLLGNYRRLLRDQGRTDDAQQISARLGKVDDSRPFHWLSQAHARYADDDLATAATYYRKALELAPYLHEAHFGLARVQYRMGKTRAARRQLKAALEWSGESQDSVLYRAKLDALAR